jgi:hypothetical protein
VSSPAGACSSHVGVGCGAATRELPRRSQRLPVSCSRAGVGCGTATRGRWLRLRSDGARAPSPGRAPAVRAWAAERWRAGSPVELLRWGVLAHGLQSGGTRAPLRGACRVRRRSSRRTAMETR